MPRADQQSARQIVLPAPGEYRARNFCIIDEGTQKSFFNGKEKFGRKMFYGFELSDTSYVFSEDKGAQPFMVNFEENLSTHEKANLRKLLENWRGVPLTPAEIADSEATPLTSKYLGKACMITVVHNPDKDPKKQATMIFVDQQGNSKTVQGQRVYANIGGIRPLPKESRDTKGAITVHAVAPPDPINEKFLFDMDDPNCTKVWDKIFPWIQKKIQESPEYKEMMKGQPAPVAQNTSREKQPGDEF